jgi:hypothetical protein
MFGETNPPCLILIFLMQSAPRGRVFNLSRKAALVSIRLHAATDLLRIANEITAIVEFLYRLDVVWLVETARGNAKRDCTNGAFADYPKEYA